MPPRREGKMVALATKGGISFARQGGWPVFRWAKARLSGFRRQRRHKKWRPIGRPPSQRSGTIYLPRAEPSTRPGGVSRSRTEPLAPRARGPAAPSTLAAKPRQPSGIQPSADSPSKAPRLKYRTQQKSTNLSTSASFLISSACSSQPFQPR